MAKFIVLVAALAACHAVPVQIVELPDGVFRAGRSPGVAWSFGSGFASDIGGVRHASGQSGSFQSGDALAYGSGFANANNNYASGNAFAHAPQTAQTPAIHHNIVQQPAHQNHIVIQPVPLVQYNVVKQPVQQHNVVQHPVSHQHATIPHHQTVVAVPNKPSHPITTNYGNYGSASSSAAANSFNGHGSASSNVYNSGFNQYQTAVASAQNYNGLGYKSAVASANANGYGQGSAVSSAQNIANQGTAVSSAQAIDRFNNFESAVAAAENYGNYQASTAQTIKQRGNQVQQNIASSVNAPGFQAANANAYNTGFY